MQMYKKIVITGANSFLGTNVILELCSRGIQCRALVRHLNPTLENAAGVEIFYGNPIIQDDLIRAAQGCDCIIHIASITDQSLLRYEDYREFNVGAVENVIAAARQCAVKRVVYVSSANTIGSGTPVVDADENTPPNPLFARQLYARSKIEAEAKLNDATDVNSVILNPTFMLGPYDSKPSSGQIIMMGYRKWLILATPGGKNMVSVKACAVALCNAIENGEVGQKYLLAGQNISIAEFYRAMTQITGQKSRVIVIPKFPLILAGYVGDLLRLCAIRTQISSTNMRVVCSREYYCADKARRQLSLPDTDIKECITQAIEWFRDNKMLKS